MKKLGPVFMCRMKPQGGNIFGAYDKVIVESDPTFWDLIQHKGAHFGDLIQHKAQGEPYHMKRSQGDSSGWDGSYAYKILPNCK